jgi:hypothetical protein
MSRAVSLLSAFSIQHSGLGRLFGFSAFGFRLSVQANLRNLRNLRINQSV